MHDKTDVITSILYNMLRNYGCDAELINYDTIQIYSDKQIIINVDKILYKIATREGAFDEKLYNYVYEMVKIYIEIRRVYNTIIALLNYDSQNRLIDLSKHNNIKFNIINHVR